MRRRRHFFNRGWFFFFGVSTFEKNMVDITTRDFSADKFDVEKRVKRKFSTPYIIICNVHMRGCLESAHM